MCRNTASAFARFLLNPMHAVELLRIGMLSVALVTVPLDGSPECYGDDPAVWNQVIPRGNVGTCSVDTWKRNFPGCEFEDGVSEGHLQIAERDKDLVYRVTCKGGRIGPTEGGVGWRWPFAIAPKSSPPRRAAELRYTLRFVSGFQFVKGGKLLGLCGGPKTITGGESCTGYEGWSVRVMWRRDGRGQAYAYHPKMKSQYGDEYDFPKDFRFPIDQPVQLRIAVKMNDADQENGELLVWATLPDQNEKLVVEQRTMQWTKDPSIGVDSLLFNVFHGGNDKSWAPSNDCFIDFGSIAYR